MKISAKTYLCRDTTLKISNMAEKSHYNYRVEPQDVDFTLRATIPSLGSAILNTAASTPTARASAWTR